MKYTWPTTSSPFSLFYNLKLLVFPNLALANTLELTIKVVKLLILTPKKEFILQIVALFLAYRLVNKVV